MNLCNQGVYSTCLEKHWEAQEGCKYAEKATHADRCMYNIDGRCDNKDAQKEAKK